MNLHELCDDKRILIVGNSGAGKTTLARKLSSKLNLPIIHLDQHYWKSGWIESTREEWEKKVDSLTKQPTWIMEGNYSSSLNQRLPMADSVIILDIHPLHAIFRVTKRIFRYFGRTRPDLCAGCPERFDWEFIKFIWHFPKVHGPRVEAALEKYGKDVKVFRLSKLPKLTG